MGKRRPAAPEGTTVGAAKPGPAYVHARSVGVSRVAAALATGCTLAGATLVVVAVMASRPLWWSGYVSEAGVGPRAAVYRAGILGLGLGLLLFAVAVARTLPVAAASLVVGGLGTGLSGSVPCSEGCPLPPYEVSTWSDLVHGAASTVAVAAVGLTILLVARAPQMDGFSRAISRCAALTVVPLVAVTAVVMLGLGRGELTGLLERATLAGAIIWSLALGVRLSQRSCHGEPALAGVSRLSAWRRLTRMSRSLTRGAR